MMILKNTKLRNDLKRLTEGNPEIEDILLFGSVVRGKDKPGDIDVMVLFKTKVDKDEEYKIRKEIEKHHKEISIISKTVKTALEPSFDARESILFEGVSLLSGKRTAEIYGFDSLGLFKYDFKDWNNLKKTKFYHALNGRGGKGGVLRMLSCIKLSDGIILAPLDKVEMMREFLESWQLDYVYIPFMIPQRLNKEHILKK